MQYEFNVQDAWDFARRMNEQPKQKGDELHFRLCPYCRGGQGGKDKETFSINLITGQFKCLRASCGITGNMVTLAKDFDFRLSGDYQEYLKPSKQFRSLKTPTKPIVPKDPAIKYLESRGISKETAALYEITVQNGKDNILVFPFYDENGKLQFVKYRKTDFNKEKDKNKEWCESSCKPILFGMKQCKDFTRLILTEGQLDSLSVAESGIDNAVSVPTGAKGFTWIPYCWDWVRKFEEIIVFGDCEKGKVTLLEEIKSRFPNKIRVVRMEDYQGCKDANEILQKHGKDAVRKAVEQAEMLPVKRIKQFADIKRVDIYKLPKLKTGFKELDKILGGGLFFGQVDLICGKRGDGKSTVAQQIIGGSVAQGYPTLIYSGELTDYLCKSWLDFQMAGPSNVIENYNIDGAIHRFITNSTEESLNNWYRDKLFIYDNSIIDDDEPEDLIKTITESIMQYGIKVILIDNLMTAIDLDASPESDKYERQSKFVKKLAKIATKYDVLILLVAHRRKNGFTTDANDEVSGSADITNAAGVVMSYDRDTELPQDQRKLILSKSRIMGKLNYDGYILQYDEKSKRIFSNAEELNRRYGWEKENNGFYESAEGDVVFA